MIRTGAVLGSLAFLAGACGAGGLRPRYAPFPEATRDTIVAEPEDVVRRITRLVQAESLPVRWSVAREGYVETGWFNPETGAWGGGASLNAATIVRLRFWADRVREGTSLVVGEAVHRHSIDPSVPVRETEAPVGPSHAGYAVLRRLMDALRGRESG